MQRMIVIEPPKNAKAIVNKVNSIAKKSNSPTNYKRTTTSTSPVSLRNAKAIAKKYNSPTNYKRTTTSTSPTSLQRVRAIVKKH